MTERTYRLSPPDRTGFLFGLSAAQVTVLGIGVVISVLALNGGIPLILAVLPLGAAAAAAFVPVADQPLVSRVPVYVAWAARSKASKSWLAPVAARGASVSPELPPPLTSQRVIEVVPTDYDVPEFSANVAVVHDTETDRLAASVRVSGRQFTLLEREQQDRLLQLWGQALAGFTQRSSGVVAVRWAEWAAPGGVEEQAAYVREHMAEEADAGALAHYEQLLATAGPMATSHEVIVTLVVSAKRVVKGAKRHGGKVEAGIAVLLRQLALFVDRLESAELLVSRPLNASEWSRVMRTRLDPTSVPAMNQRSRAAAGTSIVRLINGGPLATQADWSHWRVDGSFHRCFYVADWPRLELPASWMQELVLYGTTVRSLAMQYEPVPFRASSRAVLRESAKLESDQDQRQRAGFRIGAAHRRAAESVDLREEELTSGFGELTYAGIVQISAPSLDALERAAEEMEQLASACGIELRALDGRHDSAMAVCLPVALGLEPKRSF